MIRRTPANVAAIAHYTSGVVRAREEYRAHPIVSGRKGSRSVLCACGARTEAAFGVCPDCARRAA